jgi:hypothetical protein
MLDPINIYKELLKEKVRIRKDEDELIEEVNRILNRDLINENNVLNNLKFYKKTFELLDEDDLDPKCIFKIDEIRNICTKYRLRFVDSHYFKEEIPYECILKLKEFNQGQGKDLQGFKILASADTFSGRKKNGPSILFAPTVNGNYYMIHTWGKEMSWYRNLMAMPMRSFESLSITLGLITLLITLILPTRLITLDHDATYWCGYRIATYFHILIFNSGVTAYITFAFNKNFSGSIWDSHSF